MIIQSYSEVRKRFAEILAKVEDDYEDVVITKNGKPASVMIPVAEYTSYKETEYLFASPANKECLLAEIKNLHNGLEYSVDELL